MPACDSKAGSVDDAERALGAQEERMQGHDECIGSEKVR